MSVKGSNQFWVGTKFDEFKGQTFLLPSSVIRRWVMEPWATRWFCRLGPQSFDFGRFIDQKARSVCVVGAGKVVEFLRSSVMVKVAISISTCSLSRAVHEFVR